MSNETTSLTHNHVVVGAALVNYPPQTVQFPFLFDYLCLQLWIEELSINKPNDCIGVFHFEFTEVALHKKMSWSCKVCGSGERWVDEEEDSWEWQETEDLRMCVNCKEDRQCTVCSREMPYLKNGFREMRRCSKCIAQIQKSSQSSNEKVPYKRDYSAWPYNLDNPNDPQ